MMVGLIKIISSVGVILFILRVKEFFTEIGNITEEIVL